MKKSPQIPPIRLRVFLLLLLTSNASTLPLAAIGQSSTTNDSISFPLRPDITGPDDAHIQTSITKTRTPYGFYLTAVLTSNGRQRLTSVDLPVNVNEPASVKHHFHWLPNIKAQKDNILADHVFRSPCIIQVLEHHSMVLVPDVALLSANRCAPYYLDLTYNISGLTLHYGIADYKTEAMFTMPGQASRFRCPVKLHSAFTCYI